jgi:hypothetical protein
VLDFFGDLAMQFSDPPGRFILVVNEVWRHCSPRELNEGLLAEATEFVSFKLPGLNSLGPLADSGCQDQSHCPRWRADRSSPGTN